MRTSGTGHAAACLAELHEGSSRVGYRQRDGYMYIDIHVHVHTDVYIYIYIHKY